MMIRSTFRAAVAPLLTFLLVFNALAQVQEPNTKRRPTPVRAPAPKPLAEKVTMPVGTVDLLITGGTVVTMDATHRIIENGAVAVRNGEIVSVGTAAELRSTRACQTINAAGKVIIPGLINTHTHVPMSLFRGIADDLDLNDWLTKYIFPAEAKNVNEAFVRAGTRLGLAEMIRGGTTTYCDMYYFEDAIADETKRAGMRGVLGETVIDFPVRGQQDLGPGDELHRAVH